jgi:hypothetical protein
MEINKQLFEDVLSGKLNGTFVLRFNDKVDSSNLIRNDYPNNDKYPYRLLINSVKTNYTENGYMLHHNAMTDVDIIDFIPEI